MSVSAFVVAGGAVSSSFSGRPHTDHTVCFHGNKPYSCKHTLFLNEIESCRACAVHDTHIIDGHSSLP